MPRITSRLGAVLCGFASYAALRILLNVLFVILKFKFCLDDSSLHDADLVSSLFISIITLII